MKIIILEKGERILTKKEYKTFEKGDAIWGDCSNPEELKRWTIENKNEAEKELEKYKCKYEYGQLQEAYYITEYALEYCECDENGDYDFGIEYELAKEQIYTKYSVEIDKNINSLVFCLDKIKDEIDDINNWDICVNAGGVDYGIYFNFDLNNEILEISNEIRGECISLDDVIDVINKNRTR